MKRYDYIFAGAGLSGLSLLQRIINESKLCYKSILVIDKTEKNINDKTWCFWEKTPDIFEPLVIKKWNNLMFHNNEFSKKMKLEEYSYKMIQSLDFYQNVLLNTKNFDNIEFSTEEILEIGSIDSEVFVKTSSCYYTADYVFNSTNLLAPQMNLSNTLLQHFMGWRINTSKDYFDPEVGTLMDFRVRQKYGASFMYILPLNKKEALIEFTIFSEKTCDRKYYSNEIKGYINKMTDIDDYQIISEEFGVIPMTTARFKKSQGFQNRIVNIGTAGGQTKASTGYTFQFVQKASMQIVKNLTLGKAPVLKTKFKDRIYRWHDIVLLDLLIQKKIYGDEVFGILFKKVNAESVLAFLANESTYSEESKIRRALFSKKFVKSGLKNLLS